MGIKFNPKVLQKRIEDIGIHQDETWAIYGTGNASECLFELFGELSLSLPVKYVLDRDEKVVSGTTFHAIPMAKLCDVQAQLDVILIAAFVNYRIIEERIRTSLNEEQRTKIRVINIFTHSTMTDKADYVKFIEKGILKSEGEFVSFNEEAFCRKDGDVKAIAWFLPQFHQIDINNKFHGQGFTEWTNTTRAVPIFTGHYQPHIPYDVGYYDLLNIDTFKRQIFLAKHYGIYGFCFHYYWFSGQKIMEKPLELFLKHTELDIPFCLDWATENWTTLWDGGNRDIMYEQRMELMEAERFMDDIIPYMKDRRYIKVDGKPILVLYKVAQFEKKTMCAVLNKFREIARENGFPDLYIMITNAGKFDEETTEWGADALTEFPPHGMHEMLDIYIPEGYINPNFNGTIYDASSYIENRKYMKPHTSSKFFRSAFTSWDNTARKALSGGSIICGLNPQTFKIWLKDIICESKEIHKPAENIVFLNSWNEWAEGSHLEPDMKYGYAWLQACKEAMEETR